MARETLCKLVGLAAVSRLARYIRAAARLQSHSRRRPNPPDTLRLTLQGPPVHRARDQTVAEKVDGAGPARASDRAVRAALRGRHQARASPRTRDFRFDGEK